MGRPEIVLDEDLVQELAKAQLTNVEIARICKCSEDTLTRRFADSLKEWKQEGVASMRRELYVTGMGDSKGKVSAMIFFLKNFGGMADSMRHSGTVEQHHDLSGLSTEQLAQLESLVETAYAGKRVE